MSAGYLEVRHQIAPAMVMTESRGAGPPMNQRKRMYGRQSISEDKD